MEKHIIRLTESQLTQLVAESVKRVLKEDFNQFSDDDFAGADPYYSEYEDENYGPLDGHWSFNPFHVDVNDYGGDVEFDIVDRHNGKHYKFEGEEAKTMKERILQRIPEVKDTAEAIRREVLNLINF